MKKVLAIFVAAAFLFGTSSFRLSEHYCCGFLSSTDLLVTGALQDCGMNMPLATNIHNHKNKVQKNCCKNTVKVIDVSGKYFASHYNLDIHVPLLATLITHFEAPINSAPTFKTQLFQPPDPPNISIHKMVSVFLI